MEKEQTRYSGGGTKRPYAVGWGNLNTNSNRQHNTCTHTHTHNQFGGESHNNHLCQRRGEHVTSCHGDNYCTGSNGIMNGGSKLPKWFYGLGHKGHGT